MVLSYYLFRLPYAAAWRLMKATGRTDPVVLYCANTLDWQIFQPVQKYLQPLPVVAKDKKVQQQLATIGVASRLLPVFPKGVVMIRQATYRFPSSQVKKIGMRHGPFVFKRFANAAGYNMFDAFLMTSEYEVELARAKGIKTGRAVGFPKLDPALDGSICDAELAPLRARAELDPAKKTVLFTATWDESGVSAVNRWAGRLGELRDKYNVIVTVHPWTTQRFIKLIDSTPGVFRITGPDVVPWIMLADACVGDSSSILAECCALDKPLVTFKLAPHRRLVDETMEIIYSMSVQIDNFSELPAALEQVLDQPGDLRSQRSEAQRLMFDKLDGKAGLRAANEILAIFPELAL